MVKTFRRLSDCLLNRCAQPSFWVSAGVATLGYFAASRLLQDWLSRGVKRPADLFASLGERFWSPEPLEVPLYLISYLVIPLLALVFAPFLDWCIVRVRPWWRSNQRALGTAIAVLAVVAAALAAWRFLPEVTTQLGGYLQRRGLSQALWLLLTKRYFVTVLLWGGAGVTFLLAYWASRRQPLPMAPAPSVERAVRRWQWFIPLVLAVLVFHPNFPVESHHADFFIGPVNDILHGKALLYETSTLYGVVVMYFLAAVFGAGLLPFTYQAFTLLVALMFWAFLVGLWLVLRRLLRSASSAALGVLAVYAVQFLFQTSPTRSVFHFPAMTPFRYWISLPVLALVVSYHRTGSRRVMQAAVALATLALYWNIDSGLAIVGATFFTLLAVGRGSLILRLLRLGATFASWTLGWFVLITLGNRLAYGVWPHWVFYLRELGEFARGYAVFPLPAVGLFELLILASLAVGFWQLARRQAGSPVDAPVLWLALYGALGMVYYIGESTWQLLYVVTWPYLVLAVIGAGRYFSSAVAGDRTRRVLAAAFSAGVFFIAGLLTVKLPVEFGNRNYRTIAPSFTAPPLKDAAIVSDAPALQALAYPRLATIHFQDTVLLHAAGKVNLLPVYYSYNLFRQPQLNALADLIELKRPPVVLVDNGGGAYDRYSRERSQELAAFRTQLPADYVLDQKLTTVDLYRRR